MICLNFSLKDQDPEFLDISKIPYRPLNQLFTSIPSSTPNWEIPHGPIQSIQLCAMQTSPQSLYSKKIKSGSQNQCDGSIDSDLAEEYCDALDELKKNTNIGYSKDRLVTILTGGTCSAMAFQFADDYIRRKSHQSVEEIIDEISPKYEHSCKTFRTNQAVFNTLHRDSHHPSDDFMRDKVASMLRFYDYSLTDVSDLFYIESCSQEELSQARSKIESFLTQFPEGVFVIRCILMENNDKGEAYGHTTLLIKTNEKQYFYDPDEGIFQLAQGNEIEGFYRLVKSMMLKIIIPYGRIYKIGEA